MTILTHRWIGTFDLTTPQGFYISEIDFIADIEGDTETGDIEAGHVEISAYADEGIRSVEMPDWLRAHFDAWLNTKDARRRAWIMLHAADRHTS